MHESRIDVFEIRALRNMITVILMNKLRKIVIEDHYNVKKDIMTKIQKKMLIWLGK